MRSAVISSRCQRMPEQGRNTRFGRERYTPAPVKVINTQTFAPPPDMELEGGFVVGIVDTVLHRMLKARRVFILMTISLK